jgi:hypothetical protein
VTIKRVSNASDLSKIGIMANQLLLDWESDDRPVIVCIHSLTAMLQYVSSKQLFQFLDILAHRLSTLDATTHCHMNPNAHDDILIETFRPLFDSIVQVSRHGEIELL